MQTTLPLTRDLVLIGGGHAHALVLKKWGMNPLAGARLTVIDPDPATAYTGMLPGFVAGHYNRADLEIDLVRLARFAGARLVLGRAEALDPERGLVTVQGRPPIRFDVASLDIGVRGRAPEIDGFEDHVVTAKPLGPFADRWTDFLDALDRREVKPRVAVIGAGAGGTELALAAAHRLKTARPQGAEITLIEAGDTILPHEGGGARKALLSALHKAGVKVRTGAMIRQIQPGAIRLADGAAIRADFIIGAAGAAPWPWIAKTGLAVQDGYVKVGRGLRSVSHDNVFAAGDCAHFEHAPRPKAGVFAVRGAPVLFDNLRKALQEKKPDAAFSPQRDYLKLVSTGPRAAVAEKWGLTVKGPMLWGLKNRIDRTFMNKLTALEPMTSEPVKGRTAAGVRELVGDGQPLCGGCGSKAARGPLAEGLADLPAPRRADVIAGAGGDAAVLAFGDRVQAISTDHVRAFVDDPFLLGRIVAVHALGDVWASGAAAQAGLAQIILPQMRPAMQAAAVRDILAGASEVFAEAGADLVGGHTSVGAELTVGFTVTGVAERAIPRRGARPGDGLLLTKPVGTGVLLAGEMALKARGRDVAACWASMARSQGAAARMLAGEARAMTDVTGFGLAGHLLEMLTAGARAEIDLAALPLLSGAESLAEAGVRSTLHEANALSNTELNAPNTARAALLTDPQTAGGLLAAVPEDRIERVMRALTEAGEMVWRIGRVEERGEGQAAIRAR
ncbi:MAG: selenide, water dikinase SelD [Oceanicaulis sp.]